TADILCVLERSGRMYVDGVVPPVTDGVVLLRPWEDGDADALVAGINRDPEITAWLELIPQPYTIAEARMWISLSGSMWRERTGSSFALVVDGGAIRGVGINWVGRDQGGGGVRCR